MSMEKVTCFGTDKVKDTSDCCNNFSFDEKDSYGISWPPRHYTCNFCRRKFKSAQALGGHMNVHRRDRAMLRQPPSWVVQYPNSNPSPNLEFKYSSSSSSSLSPSATLPPSPYSTNYKLNSLMMMSPPSLSTSLSSASPPSPSIYDERKLMVMGPPPRKPASSPRRREKTKQSMKSSLCSTTEILEGFNQEDDEYYKVMNNGQSNASRLLDLEVGLVRNKKEDLDLELRLGYSLASTQEIEVDINGRMEFT